MIREGFTEILDLLKYYRNRRVENCLLCEQFVGHCCGGATGHLKLFILQMSSIMRTLPIMMTLSNPLEMPSPHMILINIMWCEEGTVDVHTLCKCDVELKRESKRESKSGEENMFSQHDAGQPRQCCEEVDRFHSKASKRSSIPLSLSLSRLLHLLWHFSIIVSLIARSLSLLLHPVYCLFRDSYAKTCTPLDTCPSY